MAAFVEKMNEKAKELGLQNTHFVNPHGLPGLTDDQPYSTARDLAVMAATLAHGDSDERVAALDIFYQRYRDDPLVLDKWFQVQAWSLRPDTVDAVKELAQHPDFTFANPNRVRSLYGALSGNQAAFHQADGEGYRLIADLVIALDPKNPQTAARMIPPLGRWERFDEARAAMMKAELERILAQPGLSRDVTEQASKSLMG